MSYQGSFDPDDMELDFDNTSTPSSSTSSPPDTPVSTPLTAYPSVSYSSLPPSPRSAPISAFETTTVLPSRSGHSSLSVCFPPGIRSMNNVAPTHDVFNAYAGYSDYSSLMPGTAPSPSRPSASSSEDFGSADHRSYAPRSGCVTPALLLNSSANTPDSTPGSSRVASPAPALSMYPAQSTASSATMSGTNASSAAGQTPRASTTLSRPATSLLLSKPFRCPKPNCNKSYKQANGLKYHMTHGSCNFAPPKDLEHLQALLASKRSQKAEEGGEPISDAELREVEKEAERRLRPYACSVGDCQRRYKNMNGLRAYHITPCLLYILTHTELYRLPLPTLGRSRRDRAGTACQWSARVPAEQQEFTYVVTCDGFVVVDVICCDVAHRAHTRTVAAVHADACTGADGYKLRASDRAAAVLSGGVDGAAAVQPAPTRAAGDQHAAKWHTTDVLVHVGHVALSNKKRSRADVCARCESHAL